MIMDLLSLPSLPKKFPTLVIGAAQLGMKYGIANQYGMPNNDECTKMLKTAIKNGVKYIDTARTYGRSEERISRSLGADWIDRVKIITKLSPFSAIHPRVLCESVQAYIESSISESCQKLGKKSLDVLLLHRAKHLRECEGEIFKHLLKLQNNGLIKALGVSVQTPEELEYSLDSEHVHFIQLPFNILDWRWEKSKEKILSEKKRRDLVVHVRSIFLQGLLLSQHESLWRKANVVDSTSVRRWLDELRMRYQCNDVAELCIRYVRSQSWVDGLVIGMETVQQLERNIKAFQRPLFSESQLHIIESSRPHADRNTLNPACWLTQ